MTTLERTLRLARDGPVMTLELHRPEANNALDQALLTRLAAGLRLASEDPAVRAIILTGAGDVFATSATPPADSASEGMVIRRLREIGKPVIAAINGAATGSGLDLALACTFHLAADTARLDQGLAAEDALAAGLIDRVVPRQELLTVAHNLAQQLATE